MCDLCPLVGAEGWETERGSRRVGPPGRKRARSPQTRTSRAPLPAAVIPFDSVETVNLDPLLNRIGRADVVLIGEASHGTSEFYKMRSRITRETSLSKRTLTFRRD